MVDERFSAEAFGILRSRNERVGRVGASWLGALAVVAASFAVCASASPVLANVASGAVCPRSPNVLANLTSSGTCGPVVKSAQAPAHSDPCAWATQPQKDGRFFSAGATYCRGASCHFKNMPGAKTTWLGVELHPKIGYCADGRRIRVSVYDVGLTHPGGQRCKYSVRPDIGFFRGFRIPPDWGGTLTVVWTLETFTSKWIPIASQAAAARYRLNGTSDGCDLLFASGSPFITLP